MTDPASLHVTLRFLAAVCFGFFALLAHAGEINEDVSLGSLTCSPGDEIKADEAAFGPAFLVLCSFRSHAGAEEVYSGRMFRQNGSSAHNPRAIVWAVRGPSGIEIAPGFLEQTYTIRSSIADGAVAPLVPKDGDDTAIALYDMRATPGKKPGKGVVTTLELQLMQSLVFRLRPWLPV